MDTTAAGNSIVMTTRTELNKATHMKTLEADRWLSVTRTYVKNVKKLIKAGLLKNSDVNTDFPLERCLNHEISLL